MPTFYKNILFTWGNCSSDPIDIRNILGQFLWYNKFIKNDGKSFYWKDFANAGLLHFAQMCENHEIKSWIQIKQEYDLNDTLHFKYMQLVNAIPNPWKQLIREVFPPDLVPHVQGVLLCTRQVPVENLNSKQIYDIILRNESHIPTAQTTLRGKFPLVEQKTWKNIYMIPRKATKHAYSRSFQYKILNNILYLNNRLSLFGLATTSNCSLCGAHEENFNHLFVECSFTTALWHDLTSYFPPLAFPALNSQSVHLGYLDDKLPNFLLLNHLLLIFKIYVYNSKDVKTVSFVALLARIEKNFNLEIRTQFLRNDNMYEEKWRCITHIKLKISCCS